MYTPFGDETENLKTRLFMVNHQQSYGADSQWEMTGYFRRHTDHYVLIPFNFNAYHETDVASLALAGEQAMGAAWRLHYGAQFTADSIESTTLEQGDYTDRSFYKLSFAPEYILELNSTDELSFLAGLAFDDTNRDDTESEFSPIASITWLRERAVNDLESLYLSFAQATQVPGYTAIGGSTGPGLFASNRDLGREISQNLELGTVFKRSTWSVEAAVFYRWDDDLVDWTYTGASNTARTANSVDVETFGIELIGTRKWRQFELIGSYAYLDKVEDYRDPAVVGSFYALNYAKHRMTLGGIWRPVAEVAFRFDNEWRAQAENALRTSSDNAFFTHLSASYYPNSVVGLELFVAVDNLWSDDFQEVPGTPGRGDQYSAGATYRW